MQKPAARIYVYFWDRMGRKGQLCRVLVRGKMNSCAVEFLADGFQAVTSRNALRRAPEAPNVDGKTVGNVNN